MIGEKNGKSFCMFTPVKSSSRQVSTVRLRKKCWRSKVCPVFGAPFCDSEVAPFPPSKRLLYRQLTGSIVKSLIFFQQVFDSVFSLWL